MTIEWARNNKAIPFIGPLLKERFNKGHFKELTLKEAEAFYNNLPELVKAAMAADDEKLMP